MDFIKKSDLGNFTLYNLRRDPSEASELSTSEPDKHKEMKEKLIKLHAEIRAEGPVYELGSKKKKKK